MLPMQYNMPALLFASIFGMAAALGYSIIPSDMVGPSCIDPPEIYKVDVKVQAAPEVIESLLVQYNDNVETRGELDGPIDPKESRMNALFGFVGTVITGLNKELFKTRIQIEPKADDAFDSPESEAVMDKGCSSPNAFDHKATMAMSAMINAGNSVVGGNIIISYCMENHNNTVKYVFRPHGKCGFLILVKWNGIEDTAISIKKALLEVMTGDKNAVDDNGKVIMKEKSRLCGWAGACMGHAKSKLGGIMLADYPLAYTSGNLAYVNVHAD
jgi:hypothetical protein